MMRKEQEGFSLIELLIVVAIILIIAAIAIPNLLRARMTANEASAVTSLRTINTSETSYSVTYPTVGFSASLVELGGTSPCTPTSTTACLLQDSLLAAPSAVKSGYTFKYSNPAGAYSVTGDPVTPGVTGIRGFFTDQSNVIRVSQTGTAKNTDPPIQ